MRVLPLTSLGEKEDILPDHIHEVRKKGGEG